MTEPVIARHAFDGVQPTGEVSFTAMADGTADDYAGEGASCLGLG